MNKIMECVPNFSEGRDLQKIDKIVAPFRGKQGVKLLDYSNDEDHNRLVVTVVGEPEPLRDAVLEAIGVAVELIDLNHHQGQHPRMGAVDVVPFIPIRNVTMEEAVALSKEVGKEVAKRYNLPVFLYEKSASAPHRENLAAVRKGEFEGMAEKIKQPEWHPDFGLAERHPTAGTVAIGARMPLVAYNINLNTPSLEIAHDIAKKIRFIGGGLRYCKAMGVELSDRIHYVRTIMDELQRINNHLLFLGTCAQDLSALTAFLYCMRDREHLLNVMEETTGGRLIQGYYRIGGLQDDIDPHFVENVKAFCKYFRPMIQEYLDVFGDNVITHKRLENCGPMSLEDSINYALTGPAGRAAGWHNDVRKNHPYDLYGQVDFKAITLTGADSMSRYMIHINEMYESLHIIEQLIDNIPEGEYYIKQKPIIKVPEGQWWFSVEGGAGEFGVYLDSRGDKSPYRLKMRPMGLTLAGAFDKMLRGQKIADLVATGASIDFVIPDLDR